MFDQDKVVKLAAPWAQASEAAIEAVQALGYKPFLPMRTIVDVTGACEQISTLYRIDHYGEPRFLAQSGQLDLEVATQALRKVWTVIPSSRQEVPRKDVAGSEADLRRRLSQFTLFEIEFQNKAAGEEALTELIQQLRTIVGAMWSSVRSEPLAFERLTYTEAIFLLRDKLGFPNLPWGTDLNAQHEIAICDYVGGAVFLTHFPRSRKFFNMATAGTAELPEGTEVLPDSQSLEIVLSTDLCMPKVGESAGAAVRATDPNDLVYNLVEGEGNAMYVQARAEGVTDRDFAAYLEMHMVKSDRTGDPIGKYRQHMSGLKRGTAIRPFSTSDVPTHSGAGIGMNRVMQSILGYADIREATPFPVTAACAVLA
jgi:asparaginyl-tRNA synthetase